MEAKCRIARYSLKAEPGLTVHVFQPRQKDSLEAKKKNILSRVKEKLDLASDLKGFAFIAWDAQENHIGAWSVYEGSPVAALNLPEFIQQGLRSGMYRSQLEWLLDQRFPNE